MWFRLGYAALQIEEWKLAAMAYRRYCALEQSVCTRIFLVLLFLQLIYELNKILILYKNFRLLKHGTI